MEVWESVDWSERGAYMSGRHGITPAAADEALNDPERLVIDPDYASQSGRTVRVVGYSPTLGQLVTVIVLDHEGHEYGVNGWPANEKDSRLYRDGGQTHE